MFFKATAVTRHAKANACVTHGKPCVHMHANGHVYQMGGDQFVEEGRSIKKKGEGKRKGRERKERERERRRRKEEKNGEKEICVPAVGTRRTKK